jgi:formylglycine-generating enzyme required for sulfatase activity
MRWFYYEDRDVIGLSSHAMKPALAIAISLAAYCTLGPEMSAQTPAQLVIDLYAGLTITGAVGAVHSIEYVTDLALTNTASAWRCLEFLQLPTSPYLWTDKSAPATEKRFYRAVAFAAPRNMVFIPPGTFMMGSPTTEVDRIDTEGPQRAVTISRGFWMGKYELTQGEYQSLMSNNPSSFQGDLSRPLESVDWSAATQYCAKLTEQERAAGAIPAHAVYRLPTEAEWEYSCRAWTSTRFSYGDDPGYTNLANYAWYLDNEGLATRPAGLKLPNRWGLHDMHGNVWEWCQDWYGTYPSGSAIDPPGPATGLYRVIRGGGWSSGPSPCRSAARSITPRLNGGDFIGFRLVLSQGRP